MKKLQIKNLTAFLFLCLLGAVPAVNAEDGIARAQFTSAVNDREPVDQIGQLTNDNAQVYFFTEVRGLQGRKITHRWEHGDEVFAEVSFDIGGQRWRVWSNKKLLPGWQGEWTVTVVDEGGNVLARESFAYIPASKTHYSPLEEDMKIVNTVPETKE